MAMSAQRESPLIEGPSGGGTGGATGADVIIGASRSLASPLGGHTSEKTLQAAILGTVLMVGIHSERRLAIRLAPFRRKEVAHV